MDSPGHCAEYCTYTVVDNETKNILDIEIINKRETKLNSVIMEKEGCRRALDFCISKGLQVTEFATDAHTQIRAMMGELLFCCSKKTGIINNFNKGLILSITGILQDEFYLTHHHH